MDVHAASIVVSRLLEGAKPQPPACRQPGGWGLSPSNMRLTTMLAAWTSKASLICWYRGGVEASLATCAPQA